MDRSSVARFCQIVEKTVAVCVAALLLHGCAGGSQQQTSAPAYRPDSQYAPAFLEAAESATIAVYPSIIRSPETIAFSAASQQQIVSLLNKTKPLSAVAAEGNIDPGELKGRSQWDMFRNDLWVIAGTLKERRTAAQYNLVMEVLFPPGGRAVFGIHCYIFDQQGNNAFSFLLNSHHKLFVDAGLVASDASEASQSMLIDKATKVGVTALIRQIKQPGPGPADNDKGYSITTQNVGAPDKNIKRIFVITRLHEQLIPVFMHSLHHSLESALEANGVDAVVKFTSRQSDAVTEFGSRYTAHEGIRKEFAWHTTAAIVTAFMADVIGQPSLPVYTVTEDRQLYG